jgi:hypothetical protein
VLFDVGLVYFDERAIPLLWVNSVDYRKNLGTKLVVDALFLPQLVCHLKVIFF